MNGVAAMRETVNMIHQYVDAAIEGTDAETLARKFDGATIGAIGEIYGHALHSEDWAVQKMMKGGDLVLQVGNWGERLGVDVFAQEPDWLSAAQRDIAAVQDYAKAVYASTDAYLMNIDDATLDNEIDFFGRPQSVGWVLADMVIAHLPFHAGEIASLKGVMGQKGLPW